jgi:hypothetical protein
MNKILFNIPQKGEEEELFLDMLSKEYKIDRIILDVMRRHLGEDLYFVLNVLAGKSFKMPNVENIDNICLMIRLYKKMKKMLDQSISFDDVIVLLSKEFSVTTNKIFRYYTDIRLHLNNINKGILNEKPEEYF